MKRKIQLLLLLMAAVYAAFAGQVQKTTNYLDKDQATVKASELKKIQALKNADMVLLQGHTDDQGSEAYNTNLANRRVNAIKQMVTAMDAAIKIETLNFGETKPVNANNGEAEQQLNRRVEISWVSDPLLRIKTPVQFYEVDATRATPLPCREGTSIEIPAGAFAGKKVLLKVSEYYNPVAILSANLGTTSNGAPIESAGMLHITAEANGEKVEPAVPLKFSFPRKNMNKDFKFFQGERTTGFQMNWTVPAPAATDAVIEAKEAPTGSAALTSGWNIWVIGDVYEQLDDNTWNALNDDRLRDKYNLTNCLDSAYAEVDITKEGTISISKIQGVRGIDCRQAFAKYIRALLPAKFKPLDFESKIEFYFDRYAENAAAIAQIGTGNTWIPGFGNEFSADYETDKIILTSTKLGWINCDRFMNNKLTDYTVQTTPDANVRVLMKKYNSFFINEYWNSDYNATMQEQKAGNYIFRKVPANEDVIIVCTRNVNGKIMLAIAEGNTAQGKFSKLEYKEVTTAELETAMKTLKQ